ncbi:MAG: hypothetical protein K6B42_03575 [Clostridia bacterium]|nr:hypothetical protein [Clostridia bacterium]
MNRNNKDIRERIEGSGLRYWMVADALNLTDGNFSRKLRKELHDDEKEMIFKTIEMLLSERR